MQDSANLHGGASHRNAALPMCGQDLSQKNSLHLHPSCYKPQLKVLAAVLLMHSREASRDLCDMDAANACKPQEMHMTCKQDRTASALED